MSGIHRSVKKSVKLRVTGRVQGVGFRPYVYSLATECDLKGYVLNDGEGVTVVVEGEEAALQAFRKRLPAELPPLARVDSLETGGMEPEGFSRFEIRQSHPGIVKSAAVSPDMALCDRCLAEMRDPSDRRHGYWLINCTDCGPRYSITETVPYDRPNTSMKTFEMCPECRAEYENPYDRRYHAQPVSCYDCGPRLYYLEGGEKEEGEQALVKCIEALKNGKIVAVKGLGGFHLMCDATSEPSVSLLRRRKRRPSKPFAVMFPTLEAIRQCAELSGPEAALIDSRETPVVLVRSGADGLAPSVAPGIDRLGVLLPYTPLHYRLFEALEIPLVATSANRSDEPIVRSEAELLEKLGGVVDGVLAHDRDIVNACDDSVMQLLGDKPLMLRLARGFAPCTITLPFETERKILAVGGNQKNAIALAFGNRAVVSPHIGDLGSLEAFEYFERTLETFKRFYDFEPDVIVCDRHPEYETTKWAHQLKIKNSELKIIEVQHHYAHLLACMAEYGIDEEVLGFAFDGTGYGDDGSIWGGEVFLADSRGYERMFTLKPFRLLGGEKAVREPRRAALGLLFEQYSLDEVLNLDLPTVRAFETNEIRMLHAAWKKGLNAPQCSSMGRLFDAVASLAGIAQRVTYEGESGLLLEAAAQGAEAEPFPVSLEGGLIDWSPTLCGIAACSAPAGEIASRFMATLAEVIVTISKAAGKKVVLSGGVFQNRTLLERVTERFAAEKIDCAIPSRFPVNDGGIALGQLWYALHSR
jgi:hydrogenase maturation protein HypF